MSDIIEVQRCFTELSNIALITEESGQKKVYEARQDGADIVLKIMKGGKQDLARFEREVGCVEKLKVDYVPQIYSWGIRKIGLRETFFLIEQRIDGGTYRDILELNPVQNVAEVIKLTEVLLKACCDFEACNIVHRDIKPENIMVDAVGKVWVIDFGIARHLDLPSLTATSSKFGAFTIGYAPPEQFRNNKPDIDARADLFSIGVILYESLNGSNPYLDSQNDIFDVIRLMETQDVMRLNIGGDEEGYFAAFIQCLMSRFPSRRPQSAVQALQWFLPIKEKIISAIA